VIKRQDLIKEKGRKIRISFLESQVFLTFYSYVFVFLQNTTFNRTK